MHLFREILMRSAVQNAKCAYQVEHHFWLRSSARTKLKIATRRGGGIRNEHGYGKGKTIFAVPPVKRVYN